MNILPDCTGWFAFVAAVSIQAMPLLVAVVLVDRVLPPRVWPRIAGLLWALVLLRFALPPWLASPFPSLTLGPFVPTPAPAAADLAAILFVVWALGVCVWITCWVVAHRRLHRLLRAPPVVTGSLMARVANAVANANAAVGGGAPPPTVLSELTDGACVVGLWRPIILVSPELAARGGEALDAVLRHECAHVLRRDPLRAAAVSMFRVLWWFHPAVHLCARRLDILREVACDRLAAAADPQAYRRTLLEAVRPRLATPGLHFLTGPGALVLRLHALDTCGRTAPNLQRVGSMVLVLLIAASCLLLAPIPTPDPFAAPGCLQLRFAVLAELARTSAP